MRAIIDNFPLEPRACTWELTLRCNLNCGHCGSRAGQARGSEMSRDAMIGVARQLASLGCRRVTLSGGEPTLCDHWQDVASEGARLGMRMNLITNAVRAGKDFVRDAKNSGLVNLGVSLDGLEPQHDLLRKSKGLYGKVLQLLDDCAADKLPVGVITTIHRGNLHQLEALHDLLVGRVFVWQLQIGAAMGNLGDHRGDQIRPEDLLEVVPTLARLIQRCQVHIRVADNVGYYGAYEATLRKSRKTPLGCWTGCYAGCRNVGIEADGGVKGCLSLQASTATEGNLQTESLADIWHRPGAFAYNRQFTLDNLKGFCRTCVHAEICRGGCVSMRTCEGGWENPYCYHRVATLADRAADRKRPRYIPLAIAPAALLAAIGCGGTVSDTTPVYGVPNPGQDAAPSDGGSDALSEQGATLYGLHDAFSEMAPHYGVPDDGPAVDVYAMSADALEGSTWYGVDAPDTDADAAEEAGPDGDYLYGLPPPQDH